MPYADVNGLRLYYEEHGEGPPLVLLHGGLMTIELNFGVALPALAGHHRVIAVELQGHGRTEWPASGSRGAVLLEATDAPVVPSCVGLGRAGPGRPWGGGG